jgi:hypothetical protein
MRYMSAVFAQRAFLILSVVVIIEVSGVAQPPDSGCGQINPHMTATAYSDIDPTPPSAFPPKTNSTDRWIDVPLGNSTSTATDGSEYHNNGGGSISMSMDSMCALLPGTEDSQTIVLSFKTHTQAQAGHCCSGFSPGGDGTTNPEWAGVIHLRGHDPNDDWDVSIRLSTTELGPSPTCNIQLDGKDKGESANADVIEKFDLKPVDHLLDVSCKEGRIGARPGAWNSTLSADEDMQVVISATRKKVGSQNKSIITSSHH